LNAKHRDILSNACDVGLLEEAASLTNYWRKITILPKSARDGGIANEGTEEAVQLWVARKVRCASSHVFQAGDVLVRYHVRTLRFLDQARKDTE
jgi:hypothetical protein